MSGARTSVQPLQMDGPHFAWSVYDRPILMLVSYRLEFRPTEGRPL